MAESEKKYYVKVLNVVSKAICDSRFAGVATSPSTYSPSKGARISREALRICQIQCTEILKRAALKRTTLKRTTMKQTTLDRTTMKKTTMDMLNFKRTWLAR